MSKTMYKTNETHNYNSRIQQTNPEKIVWVRERGHACEPARVKCIVLLVCMCQLMAEARETFAHRAEAKGFDGVLPAASQRTFGTLGRP